MLYIDECIGIFGAQTPYTKMRVPNLVPKNASPYVPALTPVIYSHLQCKQIELRTIFFVLHVRALTRPLRAGGISE